MINVLSFDVEDWYHCLDSDPDSWPMYEDRITSSTHRVLDILARARVFATFFVLGHVARLHPELVREIHQAGHEIASHGTFHRLVYRQTEAEFTDDLQGSIQLLASITGQPVLGYRAPCFSITRQSLWALPVLQRLGLQYDSSVFPVTNPRYGMPAAPRLPYRMAEGLVELPPSSCRLAGMNIPCGGGFYFRFFPYAVTRTFFRDMARRGEPIVFYLHPWELDPDQPRSARAPAMLRARHYWRLRDTSAKLLQLLRDFPFGPAREALASRVESS